MLYDPKWEAKKTETKEPTFAGFIAWLEQQDPQAQYKWASCDECAIAQYFRSLGFKLHERNGVHRTIETTQAAITRPHTFGAALDRARKFNAVA